MSEPSVAAVPLAGAKVLVTGGASRLLGMLPAIEAQIRIPVQMASPLARLDLRAVSMTPEQMALIDPVLATPIGLALPEPNPAVKKFNLIPPEIIQRGQVRKVERGVILASMLVAVLLVAVSGLQYWRYVGARNSNTALGTRIDQIQARVRADDHVAQANAELQAARSKVSGVIDQSVDWNRVLSTLEKDTPPNIQVMTLSATGTPPTATPSPSAGSGAAASAASTVRVLGTVTSSLQTSAANGLNAHAAWTTALFGEPMFTDSSVGTLTRSSELATFSSTFGLQSSAALSQNPAFVQSSPAK